MPVVSQGLDYSAARIPGAVIRSNGYEVARRYLWFPGQGHAYLTANETVDLLRNGVQIDAIYEQNTNDPATGYAGGRRMATQAVASANDANLPKGSLIYMCADAWLSTHRIPLSTAMDFLRGAGEVLRAAGYRVGAYGFADFIFEGARLGLASAYWLAGSEIPEANRPSWLTSWQNNRGYVYVNGVQCDHNDNYRHSGASGPGGGGSGGGLVLSDDALKKIDDIHEVLFRGGPVASYVLQNGSLPDPAQVSHSWGYDGLAYRQLDGYNALASVWKTTGLTLGQAINQMVEDKDNPLTEEQAATLRAALQKTVQESTANIPTDVVKAFGDQLSGK